MLGSATPLRRSFADAAIKEYRLAAKPAVVNLTGEGHPGTTDLPPIWWTPMLGFRAVRKVSDEHDAPGISGGLQTRSG